MKKVRFIYNPLSGETLITEYIDHIVSIYQRKGYIMSLFRLDFSIEATDMLYDVDDSYDHILIAGGDGTVNYVVNAMKDCGLDVPIAVLPTGTANDFASMLGTPTDVLRACRAILAGKVLNVDLGRANDEYFVNVFSCGLFTEVSQKTPTLLKNTFGKLAYYFGGIQELPNFKRFHIEVKGDTDEYVGSSLIFFVFNGRTAGGMNLAYLSELDDGMLDVLIVKGDNPLNTIGTIFHFMNRMRHKYPQGVHHMKCRELTVDCSGIYTTDIDGQAGPRFPVKITCEKGGLRVIKPKK